MSVVVIKSRLFHYADWISLPFLSYDNDYSITLTEDGGFSFYWSSFKDLSDSEEVSMAFLFLLLSMIIFV